MSAATLRRIAEGFASRVAHQEHVSDPLGFLAEFTAAVACDLAESVFLAAQTEEPNMTHDAAQALADKALHGHVVAIADTVHAYGGTVEMAQELAKTAATAYGARLAVMSVSYGHGGVA